MDNKITIHRNTPRGRRNKNKEIDDIHMKQAPAMLTRSLQ